MRYSYPFLLLLLCGLWSFSLSTVDSPRVNFVQQNPRYFPRPISYFEVTGFSNAAHQQQVNDTLRKWFTGDPGFHLPGKILPKPFDHRKLKKGERLWVYRNICGVNGDTIGGIIFRDRDSLRRMGSGGYSGSGTSICSWSAAIIRQRILTIMLEFDPARSSAPTSPLMLDLKTARIIHPQARVVFVPEKRDSLRLFLQQEMIRQRRAKYADRELQVTPLRLDTTFSLLNWEVISWLNTGDVDIYWPCDINAVTQDGQTVAFRWYCPYSLKELARFTDGAFLNELEMPFQ